MNVGLFALGVVLDYIWAAYTAAVSAQRPVAAGLWSVGIYAAGGLSVLAYTEQHERLIPLALGSFVGTYVSVWHERQKTNAKKATDTGTT